MTNQELLDEIRLYLNLGYSGQEIDDMLDYPHGSQFIAVIKDLMEGNISPKPHGKIRCKKCEDVVESKTVHDFQRCKCGAVFVDGGTEHTRLGGNPEDMVVLQTAER